MKLISSKIFITLFFSITLISHAAERNDSTVTIRISVVGDLMCHSPQFEYARVDNDSFDFNPVYREVKKYFLESDFVWGNLETVTAGKKRGYTGYPLFNTPDEYITALYNAGFHLLTTSNNHSLDRGESGLLRTIEEIEKNGLLYNGTFKSEEDRNSIRIINIKGISIAFLAYTYGTNGIPVPKGKSYLINLIDFDLIKSDIEKAKTAGADLVLVHYHFGDEYKREPNSFQKEVVLKTISYGADIIIGGHPHVLQPVQYFKTNNAKLDTGFVAYSLGNFFSNQRDRYKDAGVILNIELTKNIYTSDLLISKVDYLPTWVFKGETLNGNEYVILPLHNLETDIKNLQGFENPGGLYFSETNIEKMFQAFNDTNEIMKKYTTQVHLYKEKPVLIKDIKPRGFDISIFDWDIKLQEVSLPEKSGF